jgi:hypothetical protein
VMLLSIPTPKQIPFSKLHGMQDRAPNIICFC